MVLPGSICSCSQPACYASAQTPDNAWRFGDEDPVGGFTQIWIDADMATAGPEAPTNNASLAKIDTNTAHRPKRVRPETPVVNIGAVVELTHGADPPV